MSCIEATAKVYVILDHPPYNDELIFVELLLPKTKPIIIVTVYRPPKQNDFLSSFKH